MKRMLKLSILGTLLWEFLKLVSMPQLTLIAGSIFIIWVVLELLISGLYAIGVKRLETKLYKVELKEEHRLKIDKLKEDYGVGHENGI